MVHTNVSNFPQFVLKCIFNQSVVLFIFLDCSIKLTTSDCKFMPSNHFDVDKLVQFSVTL